MTELVRPFSPSLEPSLQASQVITVTKRGLLARKPLREKRFDEALASTAPVVIDCKSEIAPRAPLASARFVISRALKA